MGSIVLITGNEGDVGAPGPGYVEMYYDAFYQCFRYRLDNEDGFRNVGVVDYDQEARHIGIANGASTRSGAGPYSMQFLSPDSTQDATQVRDGVNGNVQIGSRYADQSGWNNAQIGVRGVSAMRSSQAGYSNFQAAAMRSTQSGGNNNAQFGDMNTQAGYYNLQQGWQCTQSAYDTVGCLQVGGSLVQTGRYNAQFGDTNTQSGDQGLQAGKSLDDSGLDFVYMFGDSHVATVERRAYFPLDNGVWLKPLLSLPADNAEGVVVFHGGKLKFNNGSGWETVTSA